MQIGIYIFWARAGFGRRPERTGKEGKNLEAKGNLGWSYATPSTNWANPKGKGTLRGGADRVLRAIYERIDLLLGAYDLADL